MDIDAPFREYLQAKYEKKMEEILDSERENMRVQYEQQLEKSIGLFKQELECQVTKKTNDLKNEYENKVQVMKAEF